jgi:hypothetical protein
MDRLDVTDARCEALFASQLQQSDAPTAPAVVEAIRQAVQRVGVHGCAARMAQEFGDHPEVAVERMRWARQVVGAVFAGPGRRPAPLGQLPVRLPSRPLARTLLRAA